jgi:hypothetical protein
MVIVASTVITITVIRSRFPDVSDELIELTWTPKPTAFTDGSVDATITQTPTITPAILEKNNCTYPYQYWIYWSSELEELGIKIDINETKYSPQSIISMISSASNENTAEFLRQLFATHLNLLQGADPVYILSTLNEADQIFIKSTQSGSELEDKDQIVALSEELEKYNIGLFGPGLCQGAEALVVPTATNTPTSTATPEFSDTPTTTLTPSPTPTKRVTLPLWTLTPTKRPPKPKDTSPPELPTSPPDP